MLISLGNIGLPSYVKPFVILMAVITLLKPVNLQRIR